MAILTDADIALYDAKQSTKDFEGFRDTIYKDKKGKNTIGYGFNIDDPTVSQHIPTAVKLKLRKITREESDKIFDVLYDNAKKDAVTFINNPVQGYSGNIDLNNRPIINNPDGTTSTEISFSIGEDGKEILIPSIVNGKELSKQDAIDYYHKTGEHLGKFNNKEEASAMAEKIHSRKNTFKSLNPKVQSVLTDMSYNMGLKKLSGFKKMKSAIESGDMETAAEEMKNSKWFGQVGNRSKKHYETVRGLSITPAVNIPDDFKSAFKDARSQGVKEFIYKGKRYTTEVK